MRGTPGQGLTSAFSLCVFVLLGGQQAVVTVYEPGDRIVYDFMFICGKCMLV